MTNGSQLSNNVRTGRTHRTKEEHIWEDIEKSGLPLEIDVASILESSGCDVSASQYYVDYDEGKGRQIDALATATTGIGSKNYELLIVVHFTIECKKLPGNAWVFFPSHEAPASVPSTHSFGSAEVRTETSKALEDFLGGNKRNAPTCRHYHETVLDPSKSNTNPDKKDKKLDNIFEAIIAVTKANYYYYQEDKKRSAKGRTTYLESLVDGAESVRRGKPNEQFLIENWIYYKPVIVFDGDLFTANMSTKRLKRVNWVRLIFSYHSSKYEVDYLPIDICSIANFQTYIDEFLNDFLSTAQGLDNSNLIGEQREAALNYLKNWDEKRK